MFKYDIHSPTSVNNVADWVEFYVSYLQESISKAELSGAIERSKGNEPDEDFIVSVWNELQTRQQLYGENPPFEVARRLINPRGKWEDFPEYMACLIFSLEGNPNTDAEPAVGAGKLFERISLIAVKHYLRGEGFIYGYPAEQNVEQMAILMNERFMYLPPTYRKDRNLDIFAWKAFGDNRTSQTVLLVQCAAGANWKDKLTELNLAAWSKYIHFGASPSKGFAMSKALTETERWEEAATDAGVLFDRTRLYRNILEADDDDELKKELREWCDERIAELIT